jgi:hypothetical protein
VSERAAAGAERRVEGDDGAAVAVGDGVGAEGLVGEAGRLGGDDEAARRDKAGEGKGEGADVGPRVEGDGAGAEEAGEEAHLEGIGARACVCVCVRARACACV